MTRIRVGASAVMIILALGAVTGCGGSSQANSPAQSGEAAQPSSTGGNVNAAGVAEAKKRFTAAMNEPEFQGPTATVDASQVKGKTIWFISPSQAIPFVVSIADGVKEAANAAGLKAVIYDGKGSVSEWLKGVELAVAQHAAGIILQAEDPKVLAGGIAKAKAANITVVDAEVTDPDAPLYPGVYAHVTTFFSKGGALLADYMIWKSNGAAQALAIQEPVFAVHHLIVNGIKKEFGSLCSDCKLTVVNDDLTQRATTIPSTVVNNLRREPDTDWVVPISDGQVKFAIQGMRQAGVLDKVGLISHDGVVENLDAMRQGGPQNADCGIPLDWKGWAEVDEVIRGIVGAPAVNENVPYRCFTKDNLPGDDAGLYGSADFQSAYKKLWGLQ